MRQMKRFGSITILAILAGMIPVFWNCDDTTSSENPPPGQVILVQKSAEDDTVERGIDAKYIPSPPPRNGIIIEWHPVEHDDLIGYVIRRSIENDSTAFAVIARVRKVIGKIDTFYVDGNASVGTRYYYRVAAEDEENEGPMSEAVNYKLEEMCTLNSPTPTTTQFDSTFRWQWPAIQPPMFIFRLFKEILPNTPYELIFIDTYDNDFFPNQEWSLERLGFQGALTPGRYQWRIDIIGNEINSGSESEQVNFQVQ